jgi:hypothetical protein
MTNASLVVTMPNSETSGIRIDPAVTASSLRRACFTQQRKSPYVETSAFQQRSNEAVIQCAISGCTVVNSVIWTVISIGLFNSGRYWYWVSEPSRVARMRSCYLRYSAYRFPFSSSSLCFIVPGSRYSILPFARVFQLCGVPRYLRFRRKFPANSRWWALREAVYNPSFAGGDARRRGAMQRVMQDHEEELLENRELTDEVAASDPLNNIDQFIDSRCVCEPPEGVEPDENSDTCINPGPELPAQAENELAAETATKGRASTR